MHSSLRLLSAAHQRIMKAIADFDRRGETAFIPDLVKHLELAGESSLGPTLRVMERNGMVLIQGGGAKGRSRVVRLTPRGRTAASLGLPVLGHIPAGPLSEAVAQPDTEFVDDLLPWREGDFMLRVRGDSMEGDGILDGDKVLLRPNLEVRPGEIAAVLVGDQHEATLKRVLFSTDRSEITLRASNPNYPDRRVPTEDVRIAGVFRGLVRQIP